MSLKGVNYDWLEFSNERDFNLLYVEVNPTIRTGITKSKKETLSNKISNLAIYEIQNDKLSYFFEEGSINNVKFYFYEKSYNDKLQKIEFNTDSYILTNNDKIEKRELTDKLFVVLEKKESNEFELWVSSKLGTNKQMIKKFSKKTEWRIDVYNKKILFLYKLENRVKIESIDW